MSSPPDVIELRGLRALAICGVLPEEQVRPQPVQVDLEIQADLGAAGASDDLNDTIDYSAVASKVEAVLAGERFSLLERAAQRVAEVVLEDQRVLAVTVAIWKLRPPVPQQLETTGVRITRRRP